MRKVKTKTELVDEKSTGVMRGVERIHYMDELKNKINGINIGVDGTDKDRVDKADAEKADADLEGNKEKSKEIGRAHV